MADANITDEALDWDSEATATSSNFTLLAPGTYSFRVTDFKRASYDGSSKMAACPEADITLACSGSDGSQSDVQYKLFLNRKMAWKITDFFKACGLLPIDFKDGETYQMGPLWKQVLGCTGQVEIGNRTWDGKDYNDVKKFVIPTKGASKYGEGF